MSIAPKPESAPRMTVPMTVRRESVDASRLCAGMPAGSGTYESARRKRKFGTRYSRRPAESVRWRADGTVRVRVCVVSGITFETREREDMGADTHCQAELTCS